MMLDPLLSNINSICQSSILQSKGDPDGAIRSLIKGLFGDRGGFSLKLGVTGCGRDVFDFPKGISSFKFCS